MNDTIAEPKKRTFDFSVEGGGTIYLLRPLTHRAHLILEERIGMDAQWMGGAVAVEHRYIDPIIEDLISEGYTVS